MVAFNSFIRWVFQGLSLFFFASSVFNIETNLIPLFIGANSIAFVLGFVSLITPGGLGVKEGVLYYLLVQTLPNVMVSIIVIAWRIFVVLFELISATFLYFVGHRRVKI